jgi:hypothetical protein
MNMITRADVKIMNYTLILMIESILQVLKMVSLF